MSAANNRHELIATAEREEPLRPHKHLKAVFERTLACFVASAPIQRLLDGKINVQHYKAFLRETYFYTRENPQLQAWITAWFKGEDRRMVKPFLRHAISEIGHDQLALDDLKSLGANILSIPHGYPLSATSAFTAFPFWSAQFRNPVSYLGYLYFLEAMPTTSGEGLMKALERIGIPQTAMTFISDHTTIDVSHIKLMDIYLDKLIKNETDLSDVSYAIEATGELYTAMIHAAFHSIDTEKSYDYVDLNEKDTISLMQLVD